MYSEIEEEETRRRTCVERMLADAGAAKRQAEIPMNFLDLSSWELYTRLDQRKMQLQACVKHFQVNESKVRAVLRRQGLDFDEIFDIFIDGLEMPTQLSPVVMDFLNMVQDAELLDNEITMISVTLKQRQNEFLSGILATLGLSCLCGGASSPAKTE